MPNRDWTFTQLTGSDPKTFTLTGYAAPFGRPRQKPVAPTGMKLRRKQTRYPGTPSTTPPTTHTFGTERKPMELTGRWMDKFLGAGSAERNVLMFESFISDQRPVRIQWGELLSYTGWIDDIEADWESLEECAWKLTILIDTNDFEGSTPQVQPTASPAQLADDVTQWLAAVPAKLPTSLPSLNAVTGEVFDALDDLISNVTQFGGIAVDLAGSVSDIETAAFSELERLRSGLHQFKTAVITMRDAIDSISIDAAVIDREAEDDIAWLTFQSKSNVQTTAMLNQMTLVDSAAELAAALRIKTTYQAKPGDSWESISMAQYGTPDRASDIRDANGVKGGEQPVVGKLYNIPR